MQGEGPRLSVIIPTLNEAKRLSRLLEDLRGMSSPHEVIVTDGGSRDGTPELARGAGARVVEGARGRGAQLALGAAKARGSLLLFLHADVRLSQDALSAVNRMIVSPSPHAAAFRFRIDSPRLIYRVLEIGTNFRASVLQLPYGDQGLLVPRNSYESVGGYPAVALMEDVMLSRALARSVGIQLLPEEILVSPRRWERDGPIRRTLGNLWLLVRFLCGASPERLAARYPAPDEPA